MARLRALNPAFSVGGQITEMVRAHTGLSRRASSERAVEMLHLVGVPGARHRAKEYPYQFSGGMRQRVMIAIAISCEPKVLIGDEPTTALDVTVQAAVLDLLRSIQERMGMAILLVTHDLGVVAGFCDTATVMYAGETVEEAPVRGLFAAPWHPYTAGLLASLPQAVDRGSKLFSIRGTVPSPAHMPQG